MFGEREHLLKRVVFLDLSSNDDRGVFAAVERAADFIEVRTIRKYSLGYLAHRHRLTLVCPIIHGNGDKDRAHWRLHRDVISASDCGRNIFRAQWLTSPLHV